MRPIDADELHPIELDLMLAVLYEDIKDAPTVDFCSYGERKENENVRVTD